MEVLRIRVAGVKGLEFVGLRFTMLQDSSVKFWSGFRF